MPPAPFGAEDQPVMHKLPYERISGLSVWFVPSEHISLEGALFRLVASLVLTEVLSEARTVWGGRGRMALSDPYGPQ
jgi:hypothetical protein